MNIRTMLSYIIGFLIALLLFPVLLVTAIELVTYDKGFYQVQYQRLDTANEIGMDDEELLRVTRELTDYIRDRTDSLEQIRAEIKGEDRQVFNQREIDHMVDVKDLFRLGITIRNISLIGIPVLSLMLYLLSKNRSLRIFAVSYLAASGLLLLLLVVFVPVIQANFTYYWDRFHYLFFSNDLWILNPETDIMIQMVPEPFFNQAVLRVIAYFGTTVLILGIASFVMVRASGKTIHDKKSDY